MSGSELMQAPPLHFGTGTIDGDEEGGALELGTLNFALGYAAFTKALAD